MTHRFSMLDVPYEQSRPLHGQGKGLGQRVPDVLADDGERIYRRMAAGAILWAGDHTHLQALAAELGLPLVDGDVAARTTPLTRASGLTPLTRRRDHAAQELAKQ
jgi:hypothetical protein